MIRPPDVTPGPAGHPTAAQHHLRQAERLAGEGDYQAAQAHAAIANAHALLALGGTPGRDIAFGAGHRNRITHDHLIAVANEYRTAMDAGTPPTRHVANQFEVPHSTAAKWVGHARRVGLLPPTIPGHAR